MLRVEFKKPVEGFMQIMCTGVSIDPMDDRLFILQIDPEDIFITPLTNIKHISNYEECK